MAARRPSNQVYLSAVKAEVAVAQIGTTNTFGHPESRDGQQIPNTPVTRANVSAGTGARAAGAGPVFYQPEDSLTTDDRVTHQGYSGASPQLPVVERSSSRRTGYAYRQQFRRWWCAAEIRGAQLSGRQHSPGVTTDFPPTVIAQTAPIAPLATDDVVVSALVNDRESAVSSVVLGYAINGVVQPFVPMTLVGSVYQGTIPAQANGTRVDAAVAGTANGVTTTFNLGYFSGVTPVSTLHALNALGEPAFSGYAARIQGTVTAGSNTFSAGTNDDYVQDATGGINVFRSTDTATPFSTTTPGQSVEVVGRVGFSGGRFRLDITESLEKTTSPYGITALGSGPAPVPAPVTIAALNANPESYEGQLVSIANSQIVSGTLPVTPQALDQFVTISDGTGSFSLKVDHDTDIEGFTPSTTFTVVGIIQQDDFLRPFNSGYDIAPRGRPDGGTGGRRHAHQHASARSMVNNADGTPGADFVPDLVNQLVKIRGAVTSVDFRGGNGIEYYVQDATGGIDLFSTSLNAGPFSVGDSVEAVGLVTHFNGLTEITVSSASVLAPGTVTAATPQLVTLSQLAAGGPGEALEGRLIRVDDVTITSGTFPAAGADANLTITDATGSVTLRIDRDTNIAGTPTPGGSLSIIGLLGQFDTSAPFDSGYQLFPRALADITVSGASAITATPSAWDFASVSVGGSAFKSFTITNTSGSAVTLTTPFTIGGANADQFTVGLPGTTTLAPSGSTTVSVTFQPTTAGAKAATLTIASSGGLAVVALTGTGQAAAGAGTAVVISEFRFRGPSGGNDEFVEIYNNTDAAIDISGWRLNGSEQCRGTIEHESHGPAARPRRRAGTTCSPITARRIFRHGAEQRTTEQVTDDGG
jgi:DNA/RNA endonuclease YhcR with UshA esterase domain